MISPILQTKQPPPPLRLGLNSRGGLAFPQGGLVLRHEIAPRFSGVKRFAPIQWSVRQVEYGLRIVANHYINWKHGDKIDDIHQRVAQIDPKTPDYIKVLLALGYFTVRQIPLQVEINLDDRRLKDIANSDEACLFIINHDFQFQDPVLLSFFGLLLYQAYLEAGKAETCPRPAILMNEDILKSMPPKLAAVYEKMGAVGIDASTSQTRASVKSNGHLFKIILGDFGRNLKNLFIFPEGRMAGMKNLDLKDRFQDGVADMVRIVAGKKKRVKVVPVGFSYNKKASVPNPLYDPKDPTSSKKLKLASIHIGEPILFQTEGKSMYMSVGNLTPDVAPDSYRKFLWQLPPKPKPVKTSVWKGMARTVGGWFRRKKAPLTLEVQDPKLDINARQMTPDMERLGFTKVDRVPSKLITDAGEAVVGKDLTGFIKDILEENLRIARQKAIDVLPKTAQDDVVSVGVLHQEKVSGGLPQ